MQTLSLRAECTETSIRIFRGDDVVPILEQHAPNNKRPFIHPIVAPDGIGVLTENAPVHHPWQHGVYTGLNDVNGIGFWEEGVNHHPQDGSFQPYPLQPAKVELNRASWQVETVWLDPEGVPLLTELQEWLLEDKGDTYCIDFEWSLKAEVDLTFGQYSYGGLFLRMPYREESGGEVINSEGQINREAEGQRARWTACSMPIEGRANQAGIVYMDHPTNAEHPVPWRVDYQMGISPSRCIAGQWQLAKDEVDTSHYRILVFGGPTDPQLVNRSWHEFAAKK